MCRDAVCSINLEAPPLVLTSSSLAKAELRLAIATVFRRFDRQELFETSRADVDIQHDRFLPQAALNSKGVRVVFR
jgi:hypothetical protein